MLWTADPRHALLHSIDAQACSSFVLCSPRLADRDEVPMSVFELAQFLDELADPVIVRQ